MSLWGSIGSFFGSFSTIGAISTCGSFSDFPSKFWKSCKNLAKIRFAEPSFFCATTRKNGSFAEWEVWICSLFGTFLNAFFLRSGGDFGELFFFLRPWRAAKELGGNPRFSRRAFRKCLKKTPQSTVLRRNAFRELRRSPENSTAAREPSARASSLAAVYRGSLTTHEMLLSAVGKRFLKMVGLPRNLKNVKICNSSVFVYIYIKKYTHIHLLRQTANTKTNPKTQIGNRLLDLAKITPKNHNILDPYRVCDLLRFAWQTKRAHNPNNPFLCKQSKFQTSFKNSIKSRLGLINKRPIFAFVQQCCHFYWSGPPMLWFHQFWTNKHEPLEKMERTRQ